MQYKLTSTKCIRATQIWLLVVGAAGVLVGFATLFVYFGYGLNKKVYQNEYAIVENSFSMKLRGPLDQGTYNDLTIGDKMTKYRSTIQFIEYGPPNKYVSCITHDGLVINLEVNIQLQYDKNEIIPVVLYQFNDEELYMDFVTKTIYGLLYEDCAKFYANDYYSIRNVIEDTMYKSITDQYNNRTSGVTIYNVQLKNIEFPSPFTDVIASKQHLVQEIQTQYNNRTTQIIEANSTLIQAMQQAQIISIQAHNHANLTLVNANVTANNVQVKYETLTDNFINIMTKFNFTPQELAKYIYTRYAQSGTVYASI